MKSTCLFFKPYFFLFSFLVIISGCKKETIIPESPSFNYFPTEIGRWVEYDVDSIYHGENDNNNDDSVYTFHFQVREEIDSVYTNGEGQETQIVIRSKRNSSSEDWTFVSLWTQSLNLTGAYRTEDNVTYHKLAFPINSGISWDGNDRNTEEEEIFSYENFHKSLVLGGNSFDSTITVVQIDEENFIERIYGIEKYAAGVGLIFKQRDDLGKRNGIVVKGLEYKMTVRDYGPR